MEAQPDSKFPSIQPSDIPSRYFSENLSSSSTPSTYPSLLPSITPSGYSIPLSGSSLPSNVPSSYPSFHITNMPSEYDMNQGNLSRHVSLIPSVLLPNSELPSKQSNDSPSNETFFMHSESIAPSPLPSSTPTKSLPPFSAGIKILTKVYHLNFTSDLGFLSGTTLQTFENIFRVFLNTYWPYDYAYSILVTDVEVLSQTSDITRYLKTRRNQVELIHAYIKISGVMSPRFKDAYNFNGIADKVFWTNRKMLSKMLQAKGISVTFM
jgi:hypothetical protein